jgi:molecular chaperone GrpE
MAETPQNPNDAQDAAAPSTAAFTVPADASPEEREAAEAFAEAHEGETPSAADELQAQINGLTAQLAQAQDQLLRAQAEMLNVRRRAEDEASKARKFAIESFAESMLAIADSLEAGLGVQNATPEQLREGAQATLRQLSSALERHKVIAIAPDAGTKFDANLHQAISVVPAEQDANTVVTVLQKGYTIADRTLRPALVTVAAPK